MIIGITASLLPPDARRKVYAPKSLYYFEGSLPQWVMDGGMIPLLLPPDPSEQVMQTLDGLILQGGTDVAPQTYGEEPESSELAGDPLRDDYELAIMRRALELKLPVLGVCRGHQLMNVYFGGTLHRKLPGKHRDPVIYDKNEHEVQFLEGQLRDLYGQSGRINSVHNQGVKDLGKGLKVEAKSGDVIEAISGQGCLGVQWHPEFYGEGLVDPLQLLRAFFSR